MPRLNSIRALVTCFVLLVPATPLWAEDYPSKPIRILAGAGLLCMVVGAGLWIAGRGMATIVSQSCPRCGRRVGRGRVYCEDHLQDTINEYRDQQRGKGS